MILASIIVSYIFTWVGYLHGRIFWHPSNNTFNTWNNFIWISILGSFFRLPEYRHWVEYGQGGALGLATYLRIGSNLEIWQVRKIGGRPQYFRITHYTEILNVFWQLLDYQWCTMPFSNNVVLYITFLPVNLRGGGQRLSRWYSKLVNMNKRCIRKHDFSKWLKSMSIYEKKSLLPLIM